MFSHDGSRSSSSLRQTGHAGHRGLHGRRTPTAPVSVRLTEPILQSLTWYAWSPDDRRLAIVSDAGTTSTIRVVSRTGATDGTLDFGDGGRRRPMALDDVLRSSGGPTAVSSSSGHDVGSGRTMTGLYVVGTDGSGLRPILTPSDVGSWQLRPFARRHQGRLRQWSGDGHRPHPCRRRRHRDRSGCRSSTGPRPATGRRPGRPTASGWSSTVSSAEATEGLVVARGRRRDPSSRSARGCPADSGGARGRVLTRWDGRSSDYAGRRRRRGRSARPRRRLPARSSDLAEFGSSTSSAWPPERGSRHGSTAGRLRASRPSPRPPRR